MIQIHTLQMQTNLVLETVYILDPDMQSTKAVNRCQKVHLHVFFDENNNQAARASA